MQGKCSSCRPVVPENQVQSTLSVDRRQWEEGEALEAVGKG